MNRITAINLIKQAGFLPAGALARFGELISGSAVNRGLEQTLSSGPVLPDVLKPVLAARRAEQAKVWGAQLGVGGALVGADVPLQSFIHRNDPDPKQPFNWKKFIGQNADDIVVAAKNSAV